MYKLIISNKAAKEIKEITKKSRNSLIAGLEEIEENPLIGKPLKRELTGRLTYRIGTYRIIYRINRQDKVIKIITAGHRSYVYGK